MSESPATPAFSRGNDSVGNVDQSTKWTEPSAKSTSDNNWRNEDNYGQ